jgi:hypothetical protein
MIDTRAAIQARLDAARARHEAYMREASGMPTPPDAAASPHYRAMLLAAEQLAAFDAAGAP